MEQFEVIRRDCRDRGMSIRALAERDGVHRRTVRQALADATPPAEGAGAVGSGHRRMSPRHHHLAPVGANLHSGKAFHIGDANQTQESFLDGYVRAFEAFGGVQGMVRYDNLKPAVVRIGVGSGTF